MAPSDQNNHHHPGTFDELIFRRELNEVHLLLDFISGRPNAHIWDLDGKVPLPPSGARSATDVAPPTEEKPACCGKHDTTLDAFETIKWVCKLRYPPTPPSTDKAYDATLLFYVKDRLNSLAYPATGLSIAYTYIFVEEQRPIQGAHDPDRKRRPALRWRARLIRGSLAARAGSDGSTSPTRSLAYA